MTLVRAYAAKTAQSQLEPYQIERREPGSDDVQIEIAYCGVCHSDIHQARDEWGGSIFPMVPGHEIVGKVSRVGRNVTRFKAGDTVGVGCFVDSCRTCSNCQDGLEQYCDVGMVGTYNSTEKDGKTPTQGGYSSQIVVNQNYVLKVGSSLPLERVAPLLCAGITTYSPMKHWNVQKGTQLGIMGLGGLGHMGVKIGAALGAEVSVFSTSKNKSADAKNLGAHHFVLSSNEEEMKKNEGRFDLIINTISANLNLEPYLNLLKRDGTMVLLGVPTQPLSIEAFQLILKRKTLAGSLIGGIRETQEMLDFCEKHKILADVEVIPIQRINEAYERTIRGDVKYRFSIDMKSLSA